MEYILNSVVVMSVSLGMIYMNIYVKRMCKAFLAQ